MELLKILNVLVLATALLFNEIEATDNSTDEEDLEMAMEVPDLCSHLARCEEVSEEICGCQFDRCKAFNSLCEMERFNECFHRCKLK